MNTQLAFLICGVGIAGLFFLNRDRSVGTSKALWLPVTWLWIIGSRPVSMWFGMAGPASGDTLAASLDGSPLDAAIFEALIIAGIVVLVRRRRRTQALLKAIHPVLIYYLYCLASTAWSPFPEPSFKRWIKCVGDLVMVLVAITEADPAAALHRLYSRVGFVLFPLSVVFIKCTNLGTAYDQDGPHYTGVTTNKNTFGLMLYVVCIGIVWNVRELLAHRGTPYRTRRLVAQCTVLLIGMGLVQVAHSATSLFCFILGSGLIVICGLRFIRKRPKRVHVLCLAVFILGALGMMSGGGEVTSALGRSSDFSGRTEIWAAAIASADNPLIGTGFESFWNKNAHKVAAILWNYEGLGNLNSAHDGYLQIYLDLGWIGVCLLLVIVVVGYLRSAEAFQRNRELGSLFLASIVTCAFYNITEAGFRIMTPSWISLLQATVGASCVIIGMAGTERRKIYPAHSPEAGGTGAIDRRLSREQAICEGPRGARTI